jgi:ATP-dependent Clp protease ATP-binding subunit ClpX
MALTLLAPPEMKARLDEYVIGQEDAKRVLSVAVYNHYKRANYAQSAEANVISLQKSNILMVGPTGSGKTHITNTLAKALSVPFTVADATTFPTSGIQAESILIRLIESADGDIKTAERGIIYIDEVDKISSKYNPGNQAIQQALLRFIEGSTYYLQNKDGTKTAIDTTNVLFIVGGAFVGLAKAVEMRMETAASIKTESELIKDAKPEDFARFGFIPEFMGRLPVIVSLEALSRDGLLDTLTKPKNAIISQYKKMFEIDGIELVFEDDALGEVADQAIQLKTGARSLRGILENVMRDIMYRAPQEHNLKKVIITKGVVQRIEDPIFEYVEARQETELSPLTPNPQMDRTAELD